MCIGLGRVARASSLPKDFGKSFQPQHISSSLWLLPIHALLTETHVFFPEGRKSHLGARQPLVFEMQGQQCQICWKQSFRALEKICVLMGLVTYLRIQVNQPDGETKYPNCRNSPHPKSLQITRSGQGQGREHLKRTFLGESVPF